MWKFIIYKEWLKIRLFLFGYIIFGILGIGYLYLTLKHSFAFTGGRNVWSLMLFQNQRFYNYLKFVPLAGGVFLSFAQYLPEAINKRLKLTFHLPLDENKVIMLMQSFGAGCLMIAFLIFFGLFAGFSLVYFPTQMVADSFSTILPWILAGFSGYFFTSLIILEPGWIFKLCYSLTGVFFLSIYFNSAETAAYGPANFGLFVLTCCLSVTILFSAYRFRKGGM
jgi:hypothetical protein